MFEQQQNNSNTTRAMIFSAMIVRYGLFKAILIWAVSAAVAFVVFVLGLFWLAANISPPP